MSLNRILRRILQSLSIILVGVAPLLGLWAVSVENRYDPEELAVRYTPLGAEVSGMLHAIVGSPPSWLPGAVVGGTWSLRVGPVELTDPLAAFGMIGAGHLPPGPMAVGVLLVGAIHLLGGRLFCGWLCPYGILSRAAARARPWLHRRGLAVDLQVPRALRWVLLGGIALGPALGVWIAPMVLPYLAVTRTAHSLLFGSSGAVGLLAAMLLSDVLLWEHGVCRGICPSGALQRLLGRYRVIHLVAKRGTLCQRGCTSCREDCWLGLDPRTGHVSDDCDSCGRCVPGCPTARLGIRLTHPRRVAHALAVGALCVLGSCRGPSAPVVVSETSPWTSPFEQTLEASSKVYTREWTIGDRALALGAAGLGSGKIGLRLYLEEASGTPWTGPLTVRILHRGEHAEIRFPGANAPRSVPRPALYEATIQARPGARIQLVDGPLAGFEARLPTGPRRGGAWPVTLPLIVVGTLWIGGLVLRKGAPWA